MPGNTITEPTQKRFNRNSIQRFKPAYEVVVDAIREVDDVGIVLYEPTFHGQAWHGDWLGSGFTEVPGGPEYKNRSAFSFHMYCWTMKFIDPNASDEEK